MAKKGLYTQLLWPLCEEARKVSLVAAMMQEKLLAIPIDQRFNYDDIEDMGEIINSVI